MLLSTPPPPGRHWDPLGRWPRWVSQSRETGDTHQGCRSVSRALLPEPHVHPNLGCSGRVAGHPEAHRPPGKGPLAVSLTRQSLLQSPSHNKVRVMLQNQPQPRQPPRGPPEPTASLLQTRSLLSAWIFCKAGVFYSLWVNSTRLFKKKKKTQNKEDISSNGGPSRATAARRSKAFPPRPAATATARSPADAATAMARSPADAAPLDGPHPAAQPSEPAPPPTLGPATLL